MTARSFTRRRRSVLRSREYAHARRRCGATFGRYECLYPRSIPHEPHRALGRPTLWWMDDAPVVELERGQVATFDGEAFYPRTGSRHPKYGPLRPTPPHVRFALWLRGELSEHDERTGGW